MCTGLSRTGQHHTARDGLSTVGVSTVVGSLCSDVDGDTLTDAIAVSPTNGTAAVDGAGKITVTPSQAGTVTLSYSASDGTTTSAPPSASLRMI